MNVFSKNFTYNVFQSLERNIIVTTRNCTLKKVLLYSKICLESVTKIEKLVIKVFMCFTLTYKVVGKSVIDK